ncbi:alpha/beta hydrolase family protein, partial [Phocaeicola vulgatus]|nr:alpha/beta hydrolase family protein [Phocaeicola vulgatus]
NWMKAQSYIRKDRIVISGFSLGTEPMMVLGVLDKDIYAFVYNDFLCQTQERAVVMTKPDKENRRPFPNSIRHLIPGYWRYFNFPDVVASLAPRPIIFTEGGLDRDFRLVQSAYAASGKPENAEFHHYPKFADKAVRKDVEHLDEGLDSKTYFETVNVDPPSHYFKNELVIPWLRKVLK